MVEYGVLFNQWRMILSALSQKEALVLSARFGLNDFEEHTAEQAGILLGTTGEQIRLTEARALRKLRSRAIQTGAIRSDYLD